MTSGIGAETVVVEQWIEAALGASSDVTDITEQWAEGVADASWTPPWITYQLVEASDLIVVGGIRVWADTLYTIKAIAPVSYLKLAELATVMDEALTSRTPVAVDEPEGLTLFSIRERPHTNTTVEQGQTFRHLGGQYRILAQGA